MAVSEADLYAALNMKLMSATETVHDDFSAVGTPVFEGATSAFPNGRNEKVIDLDGSTDYYTFNPNGSVELDQGIMSIWVKPDFTQASGSSNMRPIDTTISTNVDGIYLGFYSSGDDWNYGIRRSSTTEYNGVTTGETWSVDDLIHMVIMWHRTAGLDGAKSAALYIENTLKITGTDTWAAGGTFDTTSNIGADRSNGSKWNGGVFDFAAFDYATLSASYTDAEIVQALYSNTYDGGSHKFSFELTDVVPVTFTPKIIII